MQRTLNEEEEKCCRLFFFDDQEVYISPDVLNGSPEAPPNNPEGQEDGERDGKNKGGLARLPQKPSDLAQCPRGATLG